MIAWSWSRLESEIILEATATACGKSDSKNPILKIAFEETFHLGCGCGCEIKGGKTTKTVCKHLPITLLRKS
jgi:hypothetical protein